MPQPKIIQTELIKPKEEIVKESVVKEPKSNWQYSEDKDEMTSQKRLFANCLSTNEIQFVFNGAEIIETPNANELGYPIETTDEIAVTGKFIEL